MKTLVKGGFNPARDDSEQSEGRRFRPPDVLDDVLRENVAADVGAHITNKTFYIDVPLSRGMDITFERFYPKLNLLTHSFARRRKYTELEDPAFETDLARMRDYALDHGYLFLPVIDGEVQRDDLLRLKQGVAAQ